MRKLPYVYVVATSFSGTTLLSMLLDSHPQLLSIGELANNIPNALRASGARTYVCSCGQPIRVCPFFAAVRERVAQDGFELDLHDFQTQLGDGLPPGIRRLLFGPSKAGGLERARDTLLGKLPAYRRHVDRVFERSVAIARAALVVSSKGVFVDASKPVVRVPHLHRRPDVDLRIIHLVRDVRAFTFSAIRHGTRKDGADAARAWARTHIAAERLAGLVGEDRYLRFRWEDFCAEPAPTLERICGFLGVEAADLIRQVNAQPHHVIGNRMRLEPVRPIRSDESWRESLGAEQLAACETHAGALNRRFGYA